MNTSGIETVSVIGCGHMGWIFGLQCASHGIQVRVYDISQSAIDKANELVNKELDSRLGQQQISQLEREQIANRFFFSRDLGETVEKVDFIFETVPEKLELKREIFVQLDALAPTHTIIATGSSSIPVSRFEDVTNRRDKVLNTHYYPPIWQMPMGEIMKGIETTEDTVRKVQQFMKEIGVVPLMVLKESTGFLFNRIWRAIKKECLTVVDDGVGSFEDVDRAWSIFVNIFKNVPGPFALMDTIGLDTILDIEKVYQAKSGKPEDTPPTVLTDKVAKQKLGVKTGIGFYSYPDPSFYSPHWLKSEG